MYSISVQHREVKSSKCVMRLRNAIKRDAMVLSHTHFKHLLVNLTGSWLYLYKVSRPYSPVPRLVYVAHGIAAWYLPATSTA
jgi:hypothetical protein